MANFEISKEVSNYDESEKWRLFFQHGTFCYDDGKTEKGFRFIWKEDGKLKPQRGQARIPNLKDLFELLALASEEGWFNCNKTDC